MKSRKRLGIWWPIATSTIKRYSLFRFDRQAAAERNHAGERLGAGIPEQNEQHLSELQHDHQRYTEGGAFNFRAAPKGVTFRYRMPACGKIRVEAFAWVTEMMPPPETLDLSRRILTSETVDGKPSEPTGSATFRVCEKLRQSLCALAGVAGYQALLSRALTLAKAEAPGLSAVQVTADGYLQGLSELAPQTDKDLARGGEVILLAQLLELFLSFIGEALTLRLVQEVAPHLTVTTKSGRSTPFETILQEANQLKNASERLKSLAEQHPVVEDALMSISGSITNTATLLEVLVHVRDESDSLRKTLPKKQTGLYVM